MAISRPLLAVPRGSRAGFTLVELLTVVGIVGVMGAVAMFSLSASTRRQHPAALARAIQLAMMRARAETIADGTQRRLTCGWVTPLNMDCTYEIAARRGMATPTGTSSWRDAGNGLWALPNAIIYNITSSTDVPSRNPGAAMTSGTRAILFCPDGSVAAGATPTCGTATGATVYVADKKLAAPNKYKVYAYAGTGMARLVNNW